MFSYLLKTQRSWDDVFLQRHLRSIINCRRVIPHFQPIVDLGSGEVHGYEILSRAEPPFSEPLFMFEKAGDFGLAWEMEYACRTAALEAVSALPGRLKSRKYFLNISPGIFSDPRFISGTTMETLKKLGLDPSSIVIEITESASVDDYPGFEKIIRHYVDQGFYVALDDFGAGHSGLITLMAMTPHYLKFDRALISGIEGNTYKQKLVKSIVSFADNVNISTIAEGIETFEELRTVLHLGVRYGQGFFLGRPSTEPQDISEKVLDDIDELVEAKKRLRFFP